MWKNGGLLYTTKEAKRSLSGAATHKSPIKKDWTNLYPVSEVKNLPGELRFNVKSKSKLF